MMENDITMMTAGYVLLRVGVIALFAYLVYRVLRAEPARQPMRIQSNYADERLRAHRRVR